MLSPQKLIDGMQRSGKLDAYVSEAWYGYTMPTRAFAGIAAVDLLDVMRKAAQSLVPRLVQTAPMRDAADDDWTLDAEHLSMCNGSKKHDEWEVSGYMTRMRGKDPVAPEEDESVRNIADKARNLSVRPKTIIYELTADADSVAPDVAAAVTFLENAPIALQDIEPVAAKVLEKDILIAAGMRTNLMGNIMVCHVLKHSLKPAVRRTERGKVVKLCGTLTLL